MPDPCKTYWHRRFGLLKIAPKLERVFQESPIPPVWNLDHTELRQVLCQVLDFQECETLLPEPENQFRQRDLRHIRASMKHRFGKECCA